ncbi:MAG: class I SAM-dependent methyltransferase [Magnetococcus sp. MYC-9]
MERTKPYQPLVVELIRQQAPQTLLDAPSGSGWLPEALGEGYSVDGLDLYGADPARYRRFAGQDLNAGIPDGFGAYDCIVSCEGIEHLFSPATFLQSAREHLHPGGMLIVTTPNVWYPGARLQYLLRGFFPSFPNLVGRIRPGSHMHISPWSFPQLYLILSLLGFKNIRLHPRAESAPKHLYERLLGFPQQLYCRLKRQRAVTAEEQLFWQMAGSAASVYARGLVVSAVKQG